MSEFMCFQNSTFFFYCSKSKYLSHKRTIMIIRLKQVFCKLLNSGGKINFKLKAPQIEVIGGAFL